MAFKTIDKRYGIVRLDSDTRGLLFNLLSSPGFISQISEQLNVATIEFTELLFKPVSPSQTYPKGMPIELERYYHSPDYIIINIPPNFMFKAGISHPSSLCAIYRKID